MRFNWDNPAHIIGHWPSNTSGEFIIRCLGFSNQLAFPTATNKDLSTVDEKFADLAAIVPEINVDWHNHFVSSNAWLKCNPDFANMNDFIWYESLWENAQHASSSYFDTFWSPLACQISMQKGMMMKTHKTSEVIGLLHHMPRARVFTVTNYDRWLEMRYLPSAYKAPAGSQKFDLDKNHFRFFIDELLLKDDDTFLSQIKNAYDYFKLADFRENRDHLVAWRKLYLKWNFDLRTQELTAGRSR